MTAPVVSTLRLDIDEASEDTFVEWFRTTEAERAGTRPGLIRTRLAKQFGKHPLFPSSQPEWIILSEWATLGEAEADGTPEEVIDRYEQAVPDAVTNTSYNVAVLSATLLNSGNWSV